jgi:hypothetical protein
MKRSTLIDLTLKIVGIFQVIPFLSVLFQLIAIIPGLGFYFDSSNSSQLGVGITWLILPLIGTLVGPVIYILVIYQLIFRSQYWTRRILKHEAIEEDIRIKIDPPIVLQLALITSAILLFFWNIPELISVSREWFISKAGNDNNYLPISFDSASWLEPVIKIIVSLVAFTWSYPISKWLAIRIPGPEETLPTEENIQA